MAKRKVGLAQINNSFSGQNYLPYSVGLLQAYAEKHLKNPSAFEFMLPVYLRESVDVSVKKLDGAEIIFSVRMSGISGNRWKLPKRSGRNIPRSPLFSAGPRFLTGSMIF